MNLVSVRLVAATLCAALLASLALPVRAQSASGSISGIVVDRQGALPVGGATVTAMMSGNTAASAVTDPGGRFSISGLDAGIYDVIVSARGYAASETDGVALASGGTVSLNAALSLSDVSSGATTAVIGRTTSRSSLGAATTISQSITPASMTNTGQIRVASQLATLPATNISTSSSVGDDTAAPTVRRHRSSNSPARRSHPIRARRSRPSAAPATTTSRVPATPTCSRKVRTISRPATATASMRIATCRSTPTSRP